MKTNYGLVERAANGFLLNKALKELCMDLDIEILAPQAASRNRYIVRQKKLRKYPLSVLETITMMLKVLTASKANLRTVEEFGHAYFGKQFTSQVLEPGLQGIYAAPSSALSLPGALTRVSQVLNRSGYLPWALMKARFSNKNREPIKGGTHSFKGGMQTLIKALADYLHDELQLGESDFNPSNGKNVVLCTPAYVSANFFEGRLNTLLSQVEYSNVVSCTVIYDEKALANFKNGFGCLIPKREGLNSMGILFNNSIFPDRVNENGILSFTAIMRADKGSNLLNLMNVDIKNKVHRDIDTLFDARSQPMDYTVFKWPKGIPVYSPELYESWFEMKEIIGTDYPNFSLFGNYTGEISIRGICESASKLFG